MFRNRWKLSRLRNISRIAIPFSRYLISFAEHLVKSHGLSSSVPRLMGLSTSYGKKGRSHKAEHDPLNFCASLIGNQRG